MPDLILACLLGMLKFGGRLRNKYKERNDTFDDYAPLLPLGTEGNRLGDLPVSFQNERVFLNGPQYAPGRFVRTEFLGSLNLSNSALFEKEDLIEEYITGNYDARERITAAYVMADYQLSPKLSTVIGLRLENTNLEYRGFAFDEDEGTASRTATVKDSYNNLLPGFHLKYDANENNILRFAWTNTLARPNYFDLVPYAIYNPSDNVVERGNADLIPTTAMNFDLMFERYFSTIGIFSAGLFYKDIQNFIYVRNTQNAIDPDFGQVIQLTRPENGGTADVYGFETSFQRQLDFLPGVLKGVGVYVNYTYTESSTTGVEGRLNEDLRLPGTARHMFNASLSFETAKLVVRASLNYASDYVDELAGSTFGDLYYDRQTFLDLNASYAITTKWRLFAEANNLTNQPLRYYQGIRPRTVQEEFYNVRVNFGIKFDLFGAQR
jgi:TonB-dependent receptor